MFYNIHVITKGFPSTTGERILYVVSHLDEELAEQEYLPEYQKETQIESPPEYTNVTTGPAIIIRPENGELPNRSRTASVENTELERTNSISTLSEKTAKLDSNLDRPESPILLPEPALHQESETMAVVEREALQVVNQGNNAKDKE